MVAEPQAEQDFCEVVYGFPCGGKAAEGRRIPRRWREDFATHVYAKRLGRVGSECLQERMSIGLDQL